MGHRRNGKSATPDNFIINLSVGWVTRVVLAEEGEENQLKVHFLGRLFTTIVALVQDSNAFYELRLFIYTISEYEAYWLQQFLHLLLKS